MALYDDGKIRFNDEFIDQFICEGVRTFLKKERYGLVDNLNSEYCTIEHWLYNRTLEEIEAGLYDYLCGYYKMSEKNYTQIMVYSTRKTDQLLTALKDIRKNMAIENGWNE